MVEKSAKMDETESRLHRLIDAYTGLPPDWNIKGASIITLQAARRAKNFLRQAKLQAQRSEFARWSYPYVEPEVRGGIRLVWKHFFDSSESLSLTISDLEATAGLYGAPGDIFWEFRGCDHWCETNSYDWQTSLDYVVGYLMRDTRDAESRTCTFCNTKFNS